MGSELTPVPAYRALFMFAKHHPKRDGTQFSSDVVVLQRERPRPHRRGGVAGTCLCVREWSELFEKLLLHRLIQWMHINGDRDSVLFYAQ